jgi:hypothetical protein
MPFSAKHALAWAEDALADSLDALRLHYGTLIASLWLHDKRQLRGRACHCPADQPLHLVHSEGLREGADVVFDFGSNVRCPGRRHVPVAETARIAAQIGNGDIVHVKSDQTENFVRHVMPSLGGPIVLVTGDSDYAPVSRFNSLLEDDRIIHWFAQNCDVAFRHPKLTRIPIGIDNPIYTKLEKRIGFLIEMTLRKSPFDLGVSRNDMGDQRLLQQIARQTRRDIRDKPLRVLCNFHVNQKIAPNYESIPARLEAYQILNGNPCCHFLPHRALQTDCWRMHADFAFEASPRGKGLDCFRTWECLVLGTIPIVLTSTLDPLYVDEDLPVVIVDSYQQVTPENLSQWRDRFAPKFTARMTERLTNDYWLERVRSAQRKHRQE